MENQAANENLNTPLVTLSDHSLLDLSIMHVQQNNKSFNVTQTNIFSIRKDDNHEIDYVAILSSN